LLSKRRENDIGSLVDPNYRDYPKYFIDSTIQLARRNSLSNVVEIGSMRMSLNHPIEQDYHDCCCDGHSSIIWGLAGFKVYSIDVNESATQNTINNFRQNNVDYSGIRNQDGLQFLRDFEGEIHVLFLDAWDVDLPDSAEKHLEAYEIAKNKLINRSFILIDDTDVDRVNGQVVFANGLSGKGKLVIPKALKDGWEIVFSGRQTLLKFKH